MTLKGFNAVVWMLDGKTLPCSSVKFWLNVLLEKPKQGIDTHLYAGYDGGSKVGQIVIREGL